jgi:O-antigen/teichoic acid export membrane protein
MYAIYSIASYGVPGLNQLYLSISQVYIPRMAKAVHDSNFELVKSLYNSMVLKTLCYTIPVIFIVVLFAPVIIPFLFSEKYIQSTPYFQIYLFTFIFSAMGNGIVLRATGETGKSLYAFLYSLIFIIPLTYFSIKYYKLNGAIISAFISSVLPRIFLTKYDMSALKCSLREIFPWKSIGQISLISILVLVPFIILTQYFMIKIVIAILCIVIYLSSVFLIELYFGFFLISKEEALSYVKRFASSKYLKIL